MLLLFSYCGGGCPLPHLPPSPQPQVQTLRGWGRRGWLASGGRFLLLQKTCSGVILSLGTKLRVLGLELEVGAACLWIIQLLHL